MLHLPSVCEWARDNEARDLKEEALCLQREGDYEGALPLMLQSVALRENSRTICLSLSELADLYLEMLLLEEAETTCHRTLKEARRMDAANQIRIAHAVLKDISEARTLGLTHGARVQLLGLMKKPQLN